MFKEIKRSCSNKEERHIGYFDVHARHAIDFTEILRFQKDRKPTDIILGGDFLDCGLASKWNDKFFKHMGWTKISHLLSQEFVLARSLIRRIRAATPSARMWYLPGNHEWWLFLAKFAFPDITSIPILSSKFTTQTFRSDFDAMGQLELARMLASIVDAKEQRIEVLPYKRFLTLGKITYMHGDQFSNPRTTHRIFPNRNIVYGHHHTHYVETLHDNGTSGTAVQHVGVPCLTTLGPGYLQSGATRWLHGFWQARVAPGGLFDGSVVKVLNKGRLILP